VALDHECIYSIKSFNLLPMLNWKSKPLYIFEYLTSSNGILVKSIMMHDQGFSFQLCEVGPPAIRLTKRWMSQIWLEVRHDSPFFFKESCLVHIHWLKFASVTYIITSYWRSLWLFGWFIHTICEYFLMIIIKNSFINCMKVENHKLCINL
jgi:hypothetical protein